GLSVVKMMLDAWELWSAVKRRVQKGWRFKVVAEDDRGGEVIAINPITIDVWIERKEATPSSWDQQEVDVIAFDDMFWDDNGQAIGTAEAEDMNEILTTLVNRIGQHRDLL
ncbi:Hypothetical protein, putative, partial [Bodo saltans]